MANYIGGVRIYVTELSGDDNQIIANLNVLGGGTVRQFFGYEDASVKVNGVVIGDTDLASIRGLAKTNTTTTFTPSGTVYVSKVTWNRSPAICQTLTSSRTDPVYIVSLELFL